LKQEIKTLQNSFIGVAKEQSEIKQNEEGVEEVIIEEEGEEEVDDEN